MDTFFSSICSAKRVQARVVLFSFISALVLSAVPTGFVPVAEAAVTAQIVPTGEGNFTLWDNDGGSDIADAVSDDDGDTSFAKDPANAKNKQTFSFPGAGVPAGSTINSVTVYGVMKKRTSTTTKFRFLIENGTGGGNQWTGSEETATTSYATYSHAMATNPSTGTGWTVADVNTWAVNFGIHRTTDYDRINLTHLYLVVDYTGPIASCDYLLDPGDDIQAAIDLASAGDTICLNPGLYPQTSTITVDQEVTIQRTECDPDLIEERTAGDTSTEAIVDGGGSIGTIFDIRADNVTLQCLEVKSGTSDLIESQSGTPTSNIVLKNNIIHDATGDEGIQLRNTQDPLIQYNHVYDIAQDAINVSSGTDGAQILDNKVHDSNSDNGAIYVYGTTNTTISRNLIYNTTNNDAIKFGTGGDESLSGGSITDNIIVMGNQDAISVTMSDVLIDGNKIATHNSGNGAIYVYAGTDNIDITNNLIADNTTYGVRVNKGAGTTPTDVVVNNNCIYGNDDGLIFVNNDAEPDLNAENNFWGTVDGPGGAGPGTGNSVSANVDYDPFTTTCGIDPIVDENNDGIPDHGDDPLDPTANTSDEGGIHGGRYWRKKMVQRLNNLGNPNHVNAPTAPPSFGGPTFFGLDTELTWEQLTGICEVHNNYDDLILLDLVDFMAENFAHLFGITEEYALDLITNGTYCDTVYEARAEDVRIAEEAIALKEEQRAAEHLAFLEQYKPKEMLFAVDIEGYPVSSDMVWNACIRNYQVFIGDEDKPVNCRRFHKGHTWTHPDTNVTFNWSDRRGARQIAIRDRGFYVATHEVEAPVFVASNVRVIRGGIVAQRYVLPMAQYLAQKGTDILKQALAKEDDDTVVLSESTTIAK